MAWLQANWGYVVTALLAVSEALAQIPSIQANSVFEVVVSALKALNPPKN